MQEASCACCACSTCMYVSVSVYTPKGQWPLQAHLAHLAGGTVHLLFVCMRGAHHFFGDWLRREGAQVWGLSQINHNT